MQLAPLYQQQRELDIQQSLEQGLEKEKQLIIGLTQKNETIRFSQDR